MIPINYVWRRFALSLFYRDQKKKKKNWVVTWILTLTSWIEFRIKDFLMSKIKRRPRRGGASLTALLVPWWNPVPTQIHRKSCRSFVNLHSRRRNAFCNFQIKLTFGMRIISLYLLSLWIYQISNTQLHEYRVRDVHNNLRNVIHMNRRYLH